MSDRRSILTCLECYHKVTEEMRGKIFTIERDVGSFLSL
jgi:hypothetical protein